MKTMNGNRFRSVGAAVAVGAALFLAPSGAWAATEGFDPVAVGENLDATVRDFQAEVDALPAATLAESSRIDGLLQESLRGLAFAAEQLKQGNVAVAADALAMSQALAKAADEALPELEKGAPMDLANMTGDPSVLPGDASALDTTMSEVDLANVEAMMSNMATFAQNGVPDVEGLVQNLETAGMDVDGMQRGLDAIGMTADQVLIGISQAGWDLDRMSSELKTAMSDPRALAQVSERAGEIIDQAGLDLNTVAEAVAASIANGVDVDLEAMASGMGFDSFADAVQAYNDANGTNYSVGEARAALGK